MLSCGEGIFQVRNFFPGKFVGVGEDYPIKDRRVLRYFLTRPIDFEKHPVSTFSTDKQTELKPKLEITKMLKFCFTYSKKKIIFQLNWPQITQVIL